LSEGRELENASLDTGVADRGGEEGHRESGVTLHLRFAWLPASQGYEAHLHVRLLSTRQIRIASSHFAMQAGYTRPNAILAYLACLLGYMHKKNGAAAAGISGVCGALNSRGVCVRHPSLVFYDDSPRGERR
jgi:hypothetical protein